MKKIPLTKGKFALVDDEDFGFLSQWRWKFHKDGYAVRTISGGKQLYMHRVILRTPKGKVTDHVNRNGLDNRRNNLRAVSLSQNAFNTGIWKSNSSGVKGVTWNKNRNKWQSQIQVDGRCLYLGVFDCLSEAEKARVLVEKKYAI